VDVTSGFDLAPYVALLEQQGYAVVPDVVPLDLVRRLRARILVLGEEDRAAGLRTMSFGEQTQLVWRVVCRGPEFETALQLAELHRLMGYLLGSGFRLSVANASILWPGAEPQLLHSDNVLVPEPFPVWPLTATAVIPCDDYTGENGATLVVPGSHRLHRHPLRGEGVDRVVPIEAAPGSLVVWNGNLWHQSGRRTAPGERVVFHANFCCLHMATYESYDDVPDDLVERNGPEFAELLGRHLPWGFDTVAGPDRARVFSAASAARTRA